MLTMETLEQWLADYARAWETKDADGAVEIFTPDARYYKTPYDEPFPGRPGIHDYWVGVTTDQRDIRVTCDPVGVVDNTGISRWGATFRSISSGANVELNGVFILQFTDEGLCSELREWWHAR